jgi:acetolactate synthase-1/2/3 large subunit
MVVSMVGDGGFLMTGREIATAFHHGVAPIVLVFNNQMWHDRMHQERAIGPRSGGADQSDFAKFIEAFNLAMARSSATPRVRSCFPPCGG